MIHSGSRNVGKKVCDHYNAIAKGMNNMRLSSNVQEHLNFLPVNSQEGKEYIADMNWCLEFAKINRKLMMDRIAEILLKSIE
jgi:tRNA-splicing ligase RtcB